MRNRIIAKAALAVTAVTVAAAPIAAEARPKKRVLECPTSSGVRRNANNGTVIGAVAGGVLGNAVTKDTGGTLIGAGVGAVAGHEIAKNRAQGKCRYVYR